MENLHALLKFSIQVARTDIGMGGGNWYKSESERDDAKEINIDSSIGAGNYCNGGPQCCFNYVEIDSLTFCSMSGGITTDILI